MDKIALFCKSCRRDIYRIIELSRSIQKYNKDRLPFYVLAPEEDLDTFKNWLPYYTKVISDSEVTNMNHGWVGQQYVKSMLYKLNLAEYHIVIDSDSYFIKNFTIDDFMWDDDTPYMIMHERDSLNEFIDKFNDIIFEQDIDIRKDAEDSYRSIRKFLTGDSKGKIYHYSTSPFIWNSKVWKKLDEDYGIDNLFSKHPNELKWYGEAVLKYGFNYMPSGPLFKCFHYKQQYQFYKELNWKEDDFKKQYLGIVMQSNWEAPLKY